MLLWLKKFKETKGLMDQKGMTVEQASHKFGLSQSQIYSILEEGHEECKNDC